ncbi:ATP-binding protein [Streptomyces sp. NPDC001595]|uniref:ATP-binding protein n=1 Tax=Streptomyces sp. NPDC001532 TaxID=3154520 RepID=UPI00332C0417
MEISLRQSARKVQAAPDRVSTGLTCAWDLTVPDIAEARHAVTTLLDQVEPPPHHRAVEDARLVASELVTNAVRHAPGPCVLTLHVDPQHRRLRITVQDTSAVLPRLPARDPARVGGHGLHLVHVLSLRFEATPRATGKDVTAVLSLDRPDGR